MPFIKDGNEKTRNYVFQKDSKTVTTTAFVGIVLVILIIGSGFGIIF